ncbi:lipocalin family protein [Parapedobacter sp. 10938]|uniref:lipocalin family protein n=1 Tax=Parapedobacter flavus TaxID=3110225 RepID=UPI002DBD9D4E|nr:lipocalin family protein [Parapedobacter sp. 10938]MEC3879187.1 lipocalin family protein [Parapedobacter sp. 10938]
MNKRYILAVGGLAIGATALALCGYGQSKPKGVSVVTDFDLKRYLGDWYELARFDFRFEKNLKNTRAHYALNDDGTVSVTNAGYDYVKKRPKVANGKAKLVGEPHEGKLKVSFFGPFYSPYNVVAIKGDYEYALVMGKNTDYLWILGRKTTIPEGVKQEFLEIARKAGYDLNRLVWVKHD